jgi:hypothetical protein
MFYCSGGGGISMPYLAAIATTLSSSGGPSETGRRIVSGRFAPLLEELLVQPHWRGEYQHPPRRRSHILEGMQVLLGNVDEGSGSGPDSPVAQQKLVFSLQHVESLIVSRLYVRRLTAQGLRHKLKQ